MVDSKSQEINIGEIIRYPEILEFVADHPQTKNMCKDAVKKLPFLIMPVPNKYKTQQLCYEAIQKKKKWYNVNVCSSLLQGSKHV